MDVSLGIREAYYAALHGNTDATGVYDYAAPAGSSGPYIILGSCVALPDNTKDSFGYEVTVELRIVTEYKGDFGGRKPLELISDQVQQIIVPTPGMPGIEKTGLNIITAVLKGSYDSQEQLDNGRYYNKRLVFTHKVEK